MQKRTDKNSVTEESNSQGTSVARDSEEDGALKEISNVYNTINDLESPGPHQEYSFSNLLDGCSDIDQQGTDRSFHSVSVSSTSSVKSGEHNFYYENSQAVALPSDVVEILSTERSQLESRKQQVPNPVTKLQEPLPSAAMGNESKLVHRFLVFLNI